MDLISGPFWTADRADNDFFIIQGTKFIADSSPEGRLVGHATYKREAREVQRQTTCPRPTIYRPDRLKKSGPSRTLGD